MFSSLCDLSLWFFKIFISVVHHGVVLFVSLALGFFELPGSLSSKFSSKFENFWTLFLQKNFFLYSLAREKTLVTYLFSCLRLSGFTDTVLIFSHSRPFFSVQRSRVVEFTDLSCGMSSC